MSNRRLSLWMRLRGGALDGSELELVLIEGLSEYDPLDPYPEKQVFIQGGIAYQYDRTEEYTTNNCRVYRYAGVLPP